ncbi:MAG: flagellar basal body L-ring protein FlgH [Verrucomicrobiota bacterium]
MLATSLCLSGIKLKPKPPGPSPLDVFIEEATRAAGPHAGEAATGSLWVQRARFSDLAADLRASRVDDVVTVIVSESASAVSKGTTKTGRTSSAKASVSAIAGITKATGPLSNLAGLSSDQQLNGDGTTSRETTLNTTLAARVTHVLPNGYMVVEGTRSMTINSETQVIKIRGVIRPMDVDTGNTVTSNRLGQMEITVNGKGVVGDVVRRPNFLYRLLLGILPF